MDMILIITPKGHNIISRNMLYSTSLIILIITTINCVKTEQIYTIALKDMKESLFQKFQYGFSLSMIGTWFPTFAFNWTTCSLTDVIHNNYFKRKWECYAAYLSKYCMFDPGEYESKNKSDVLSCMSSKTEFWKPERWYRINFDITDNSGALTEGITRQIQKTFNHCRDNEENYIGLTCGLEFFLNLYLKQSTISKTNIFASDSGTKIELLVVNYLYFMCADERRSILYKSNNSVLRQPFCPNPCLRRNNPCVLISNALNDSCQLIKSGRFHSDYQCQCEQGFEWSHQTRICYLKNKCNLEETCHKKGTKTCLYHKDLLTNRYVHSCLCHPEYMGEQCQLDRNPCIERHDSSTPSGNEACLVHMGNLCVPHVGSDWYRCLCTTAGDRHDQAFPYPNCYGIMMACDRILCHNGGTCQNSKDGSAGICVCPTGYRGKLCQLYDHRVWNAWEPWSECGATACDTSWQYRERNCRSVDSTECPGEKMQRKLCTGPCVDTFDQYLPYSQIILLMETSTIVLLGIYYILIFLLSKLKTKLCHCQFD